MRRLLLIINPRAGKRGARLLVFTLCDRFTKAGYEVTVYPTQCAGDAARVARERGGDFDLAVCAGGDGTLSEVVGGLAALDTPPELGYIPAGTTNDFAVSLKIPFQADQAAGVILNGVSRTLDLGRFGGQYFTYTASFGLMSEVSYSTPQEAKNALGRAAYFLEGIRHLPETQPVRARIETPEYSFEDDFLMCVISNATSVGGLIRFDEDAVFFDDGLFEVLLVRDPGSPAALTRVMLGVISQTFDDEYVRHFRAAKLRVTAANPIAWSLDGEYGGLHTDVEIEILRRAYVLRLPNTAEDGG